MRRLSGLVERDEPARPGVEGDEAWRTMSDEDLAKNLDVLQKQTKMLLDSFRPVMPSARAVDRAKMDEAYPEMQKMASAIASGFNEMS